MENYKQKSNSPSYTYDKTIAFEIMSIIQAFKNEAKF